MFPKKKILFSTHASSSPKAEIIERRPLTGEEKVLVRWMLERGNEKASPYLAQVDGLQVISRCDCGCASIDFSVDEKTVGPEKTHGITILADFLYGGTEDLCGAFVFARGNALAGLEVYGLAVDAPKSLPKPESLRSWDGKNLLED